MENKIKKLYTEFKPASRGFITKDDISTIKNILGINESSDNLQTTRNAVVRYCSDNYQPTAGWTKELMEAWDIMSAATAVIDTLKFRRGEAI